MSEQYSVKAILSAEDGSFRSVFNNAQGLLSRFGNSTGGVMGKLSNMKTMVKSGLGFGIWSGIGQRAFDVVGKAVQGVTSNLGSAISRYDTLKQFPRVMEMMGYKTEETERASKKLVDAIDGLPTTLDGITAMGIEMAANRALSIVSGFAITVNKAAAGATVYYAKNTYLNRILAKVCEGGYVSRDEATSKVETIIPVVSVLINGQTFTPDSSPDDANNLIQITLAETANPSSQITQLRMFGVMKSYASAHIGNGIRTDGSGGRSLILGGGLTKSGGNDHCMIGQQMYSTGNGNAMFGRQHIAVKNRGFFSGTGHDSTNARSESAAAFGDWSILDPTTLFAIGNGTSATARSNAFEVTSDGGIILKSPNGTRYKITVANDGTVTSTAV